MEIIDAHVHALPRGEMCGGEVDASIETVLTEMKKREISKIVLVPINDISWQPVEEMNDFMENVVLKNKDIVGFIDIDLSKVHYYNGVRKFEEDIIRRCGNGLKGIKVHPQNLGLNVNDWRLLPVYRIAGELKIPVMIHCYPGSGPGFLENSHPRYIDRIVRAFYKTTFIISHFGGILYFNYMPWINHENVYFESSGVIKSLKEYFGVERVRYIFEEIGYDKIFFGSDFPTEDIDEQISIMKEIIPTEFHNTVFSENIKEFGKRFNWWR